MTEVVVALNVGLPQQRGALFEDLINTQSCQVQSRNDRRLLHGAFDVGMLATAHGLGLSFNTKRPHSSLDRWDHGWLRFL